jgi:hypothetical protein
MRVSRPDTPLGLRNRAILLAGFGGALRRSEIAQLDAGDVELGDGRGVVLTVRRSKTDQQYRRRTPASAGFDPVRNQIRTFILDVVDHLTENQGPIAPTRPRSIYFDVVVEARKLGFDAESFRQGLQEALVQDPDLLALGRRQSGFTDHARFVGVGVEQAVAAAPAVAYRVRIDFRPDGRIDHEVVDAISADNVKAEMILS